MALVLYQCPVSHYCEKVRWALDYKGLPQYGLSWPAQLPESLHSEIAAMEPQLQAVRTIYSKFR